MFVFLAKGEERSPNLKDIMIFLIQPDHRTRIIQVVKEICSVF